MYLPSDSGTYRVVQIRIDDILHMAFSTMGLPSHARILEDILEGKGYCTRYKDGRLYLRSQEAFVEDGEQRRVYELVQDCTIRDPGLWFTKVPALTGEGYTVHGMGKVDIVIPRISPPRKSARFYGTSISYEIGLDENVLKQVREQSKDWIIDWETR